LRIVPEIRVDPSDATDALMDSEVQSYFAGQMPADSPPMTSAPLTSASLLIKDCERDTILLNDRDSDDPQLLVCEEEMGVGWKDSGSEGGGEEGGDGDGGLGGKGEAEWDEWNSLSVHVPTSS
jgi:hypothetical protein